MSGNPPSSPTSYKLARFLQRQGSRDRSKSVTDSLPTGSTSTLNSAASSTEPAVLPKSRKNSKFLGVKEKEKKSLLHSQLTFDRTSATANKTPVNESTDDPPVIIEPINTPRPRTRPDRPLSTVSDINPSGSSSTTRIGDLPTRLSGWFSHTFSVSSTDLSLPSLLSQSHLSTSPKTKSSTLLTAAKHGKGQLDKAVRYLLDSDSTPDKCTEPIWLLGVQHPGYEVPPPPPPPHGTPRRISITTRRRNSPPSFHSSTSSNSSSSSPSTPDNSFSLSQSQPTPSTLKHPSTSWPPLFYADFMSRIWLTYRSHFYPIRDTTLAALDLEKGDAVVQGCGSPPVVKRWNWGGERTWTSDAGWGCMLRTGQSLVANALIHTHLGRDWRRPQHPLQTADYATYVQILTWFLDTPSPYAPFSVHRMALAGKDLGTDVGQWFGPSIAAGALKTLVHAFPEAGLGVAVASDGVVFQSDVYEASSPEGDGSLHRSARVPTWGGHAVLVLIGVRLGLDGFNPIYGDTIKALYTFPQSVGIAGGRPSSSYYFVGSQADNLFYLDPHHTRPSIPLRPPPPAPPNEWAREASSESDREKDKDRHRPTSRSPPSHHRLPTYPSSIRTGSSTFSYHSPISPSPLQQQLSTTSAASTSSTSLSISSSPPQLQHSSPISHGGRLNSGTGSAPGSPFAGSELDHGTGEREWNAVQDHYVKAYSSSELRTFHCERVRKMPLSGLDPSMLIGFLCKDEEDWKDFRRRVEELSQKFKTIFSIQDEPPTWPSDSEDNLGFESISDPDDIDSMLNETADREKDGGGHGEGDRFFDTRSGSTSSGGVRRRRGKEVQIDTEDDQPGPTTPGPEARTFDMDIAENTNGKTEAMMQSARREDDFEDDIEDDWVDSPISRPRRPSQPPPPPQTSSVEMVPPGKGKLNGGKKSKRGKKGKEAVTIKIPTPDEGQRNLPQQQHYPFPVSQKSTDESPSSPQEENMRSVLGNVKGKRMHTTRARDGGRTQSGGVKGVIPTDD